jgi:hypothetical protein
MEKTIRLFNKIVVVDEIKEENAFKKCLDKMNIEK